MRKCLDRMILLAVALLLCLASWLAAGSGASRSGQVPTFKTADQINAGYAARRTLLLETILNDSGGNVWHAAARGLASMYMEPVPPAQALINLEQATGADPKCGECCDLPTSGNCGNGAGYWALPLLIRAYYMFHPGSSFEGGLYAGRMPADLVDAIKGYYRSYLIRGAGTGYGNCSEQDQPRCTSDSTIDRYSSPPYAYISQSDNHTTIQASAILLATQMLKSESPQFAALYENWRAWWSQFLDVLARRGFWETASPTYVERHLAPIYNVYDFAEDPLLRKKAEMLIDWYWAEISQELLDGVRGGGKIRVYWIGEGDRGALSARNDCMYGVYYLYTGEGEFGDDPRMPNAEMFSSVFATSSYRPPDVILELAANPQARGSFEIKERRKGSCWWWDSPNEGDQPYNSRRYAFVTPDYVLGSFQTDADKQFMPIWGQTPHLQSSLVFATSPEARITWGEWAIIGSGQINVFQHRNVVIASRAYLPGVVLSYNLPAAGVLDRVEEEDGLLFIQEGNAFAAIRVWHNDILIIEAARSIEYGDDFARFKAAIKQLQPGISQANIDQGFVEYVTANQDVMWLPLRETAGTCRYTCTCNPSDDLLPKIDGYVVDWDAYPLFGSPYVSSAWDSGLIQVVFNDRQLTLDFRDPDNPTKSETDLRTPTPTATATSSPTGTPTRTATDTASPTASAMWTATDTPSPTASATWTAADTPSPTASATWVATATLSPAATDTPTATPISSHTPTAEPTGSPVPTPTVMDTQTATPASSATAAGTPSATASPSPTPPGGGETESWLSRLLQALLDWIRRLLGGVRSSLPSDYAGQRDTW